MARVLQFCQAKAKNFMMIGNAGLTFDLTAAQKMLYVGVNGVGKSTILDVLAFALFGKPYRNGINLPQIINCTNDGALLVELTCRRDGREVTIRRGLKPRVFEVFEDGKQVTQYANSDDLQNYLERRWIRFDYRTFRQVVVLGASSYVSFFRLPAAERRAFVEDLLDLRVISSMAVLAKRSSDQIAADVTLLRHELKGIEGQLKTVEQLLAHDAARQQKELEVAQQRLQAIDARLETARNNMATAEAALKADTFDSSVLTRLHQRRNELQNRLVALHRRLKFYESRAVCETCQQVIDATFKERLRTNIIQEVQAAETEIRTLESKEQVAKTASKTYLNLTEAYQQAAGVVANLKTERRVQAALVNRLEAPVARPDDIREELQTKRTGLTEKIATRTQEYEIGLRTIDILKDDGVKASVLRQYLPMINAFLSSYLRALDFPVRVRLNETFEEVIETPGKEKFSYGNFSDGQKKRLDLALLWTWRAVAKTKSLASTNLLILDEICDSGLDASGVDDVFRVLDSFESGTHVLMMSPHGDVLARRFAVVFEFTETKGFSAMKRAS